VHVPDQIARGTTLRILITTATPLTVPRAALPLVAVLADLPDLTSLIGVLNRERRNDRLYVGLFMPSPTILWEDKSFLTFRSRRSM